MRRPNHRNASAHIRSLAALSASQVSVLGLGFMTHAVLARALTAEEYGIFSSTYSWMMIIAPYAVFGVGEWWLRWFGRQGSAAIAVVPSSLRVATAMTLLAVALGGWGLMGHSHLSMWMLFLIPAHAGLMLATATLQLRERFYGLALLMALPHIGRFLVAAIVGLTDTPLYVVYLGYALTAVLLIILTYFILFKWLRHSRSVAADTSPGTGQTATLSHRELIAETWPFALASALFLGNLNVGIVVVHRLSGPETAAMLAVSIVLLNGIYMLPRVLFQQFLMPKLHRWAASDPTKLAQVFRLSRNAMFAAGFCIAAVLITIAPVLLPALYGIKYSAAITTVQLLAVVIPIRFVAASYAAILTTGSHIRLKVAVQAGGVTSCILLTVLTAPQLGALGGVLGLISSEALMLALFMLITARVALSPVTRAAVPALGA